MDTPNPVAPATALPDDAARMLALAREKWQGMRPRRPERLVTPETPTFHCLQGDCPEHCCLQYTAPVSRIDARTLEAARNPLVEAVDDVAALAPQPGAGPDTPRPFVGLRRRADGACTFLLPGLTCGIYPHRPDGCRQYPYVLGFVAMDGAQFLADRQDPAVLDVAVRAAAGAPSVGGATSAEPPTPTVVPIVLRDTACPGFTGPPLGPRGYTALLLDLWDLDGCSTYERPCHRHA